MYSGTTLHSKSGNLIGAHQKFDRAARKLVSKLRPNSTFPPSKLILKFEGNNGPDGIKRKSPGTDEPWHYWDPTDPEDHKILDTIEEHFGKLAGEIREDNQEKAAFEAAWLAHAVVDGLTPAHHYPYEEELTKLRGEGMETRDSIKNKLIIKGETRRQTLSKNWQMWGAKGLLLSHSSYEFGVTSVVLPLRLGKLILGEADLEHVKTIGWRRYLHDVAMEIYELNMYERFLARGWTTKLIRQTRRELAPGITRAIAILWTMAIDEADK